MIELTEEQRQELSLPEPTAIDPSTNKTYVLVRKNVYDRIRGTIARQSGLTTSCGFCWRNRRTRTGGTSRRWATMMTTT
jgi:hypothetical protein